MKESSTLYVGNLSFHTCEEQIYEVFSRVGEVKRVIVGLDRNKKTPCGFCFVESLSFLSLFSLFSLSFLSSLFSLLFSLFSFLLSSPPSNSIHGPSRYYSHEDAELCMKYINGTKLDERIISTDFDLGFENQRQFGRGKLGGQVSFLKPLPF